MERLQVTLSEGESHALMKFIKSGKKTGKELERAYILIALNRQMGYQEIADYYYVNRSTIWRTARNYQQKGLKYALEDKQRPGQPKKYTPRQEAEVIAMACSDSPKGRKRWTIRLLTEHLQKKKGLGFETLNRETVRLILKKTNINLG